ncbi:hypothetical protein BGX38DRAFT_1193136 [Terfezia claveryi]|nr:hypothetical protein BGX38DRAFT_1241082 [Terfezia claveryi]KAF8446758.1 hypothetical protein BGX38DRAFT_1193136 [Terfezia claveryi]
MKPYLGLALAFVVSFIQVSEGLKCSSNCAACWRYGVPGVDVKFRSDNADGDFGTWCPTRYYGLHCAKQERCFFCDDINGNCEEFGPCLCTPREDHFGGVYCPADHECFL